MNTLEDIMGMIASEAATGMASTGYRPLPAPRAERKEKDSVKYDLRLVQYSDGTLEWKD